MEDTNTTTQYRRTSRYPSEETKEKIAQSLRGKQKSMQTREKIAQSLRDYWGNENNFPMDKE